MEIVTKSDRTLIAAGERKPDRDRQAGNEPHRRRVVRDLCWVVSKSTRDVLNVPLERRASPKSLKKALWQVFVVRNRDDHLAALLSVFSEVPVELFVGEGYNITG